MHFYDKFKTQWRRALAVGTTAAALGVAALVWHDVPVGLSHTAHSVADVAPPQGLALSSEKNNEVKAIASVKQQSDAAKIAAVRKKVPADVTLLTKADLEEFDEIEYARKHYPKSAMRSKDPQVREQAWTDYLNNHPYTKLSRVDYNIIKELPKYDRPDLAMLHDKTRWTDPALGYAPTQRRFKAMQDARDELATRGALPGVNWTERGPNNVGGRTRAIMWDPNDATKKKAWAGGVGGGLWYNNDITLASTSWQKVNDFWDNIAVASIAYDPSNTNVFYVGTGEGFGNGDAQRGRGIWKTTNGGTTWAQLGSTTTTVFYYVNDLAVTSTGVVLAATNSGLRRSADGGATWTTPTGVSGACMDLEITASGTIIVARDNGTIHRSTDVTGTAFGTAINPGGTGGFRVEVACAPSDANIMYAVAENSGGNVQWFRRSNDGGLTWPVVVTIPLYLEQGSCAPASTHFTRGQSWYDLILQVGPTNPNILLAGGIDIHRTTDGGSTWSCVTYWTGACKPYVHADQHAMAFRPGFPNECIFGNDGGLSYSADVGNAGVAAPAFGERVKDYNVTQFYACAVRNDAGGNYFLAGAQDNGSHQYNSPGINSTVEVTGGDGAFCHIDQDNSLYQITSYVNNNYYRSTNGGASFSGLTGGSGGLFINPTDYDNVGDVLYCAQSTNTLYRITGISGTPGYTSAVATGAIGTTPTAITASPYTANRVFVAGSNGNIRRLDGADVGTTPTSVDMDPSNTLPSAYINCIALGPNDNHIIVTYSNYGGNKVWLTTNGGVTWVNKTGDLPDMPINWALMSPTDPNKVLVATEVGVWSIDDISVAVPDWGPSSNGLANTRCEMLQIRSADNLVAIATHGRGLFTTDVFMNLFADFNADKKLVYTNKNVVFTNASHTGATSWSWNFGAGATPATATGAGPHTVTYSTPGLKTVSLTINGTVTKTSTDYIHVLPDKTPPYLPADGGNFDVNLLDFGSDKNSGTAFERGSSAIAGKNGTLSAPNAWVLGLTATTYANATDSWLCTPNYNMAAAGTYTLKFRTKYRAESNYDGFIVQYSTNKGDTWTQLGTATGGTWYTRTMAADAGAPGFPAGTVHFGGTSDSPYASTYTERSFNVSFLAGSTDVAFRFLFKSDGGVVNAGCAIDDFELQAPGGIIANFTGAPTTVCQGGTVTFTSTSTGAITSYSWNFGAGASPATATGIGPHIVTYPTSGSKTVSLTLNGTITETKADYISVFPSPTVSIAAGGPVSFCTGGSVNLTSTASGVTYQWKRDGTNIAGAIASNYTANVAGVYTLEVTSTANGCKTTSNSITVTINPLPTPSISPSTTQYLCPPAGSVVLTASPSSGVSYQWKKDGVNIVGAISSTYTATAVGNYQVLTTITATGCAATSGVVAVVNGVPPDPSITPGGPTTFCSGNSVTLFASPSTGVTFQWKKDGVNIVGATSDSFVATLAGIYTVAVVDNINGCSAVSPGETITVNPKPAKPTASADMTICPGETATLSASAPPGMIAWYDAPTGGTLLGIGTPLTTPALFTTTSYWVQVTISGCPSDREEVVVNVNAPTAPTVAAPPTICAGNTITLTASSSTATPTYKWYDAASGGTLLFTGNPFTSSVLSTTTSFWVSVNGGSCESPRTEVLVNVVGGASATVTPNTSTICTGSSVTLTASPSTGVTYQWKKDGVNIGGAIAGTYSATLAGSYTVVVTTTGSTPCSSESGAATVTVNPVPSAPTASGTTICAGNTATLTATSAASAPSFDWYDAPTGGTLLASTASYTTPVLGVATTYYVQVTSGGCTSATRTAVTVTVNPIPSAPTASGTTICAGNTATLTATSAASAPSFAWYDAPTGGTLLASTASYTTPTLSSTATYYVQVASGGCTSATRTAVTVTVNPVPVAPTASGTTICAGNTATLTATSAASSPSFAWYDAPTGGTLLTSTASYTTPTLSSTATYYVQVASGGCTSATRTAVTVIVNPIPSAPTASGTTICAGNTATLTASSAASAPSFAWYDAPTGGTLLASTASYTTPVLGVATTYYVQVTSGGCTSATRTAVTVNIGTLAAPTASSVNICFNANTTLTASSGASSPVYNWYNAASGGTLLFTGASYTTPALTSTTSYWVSVTSGACVSARIEVVVTVNPLPIASATAGGAVTFCAGGNVTLTASPSSGVTYQWYKDATLIAGATGSTLGATTSGAYAVVVTNPSTLCSSAMSAVINVTVNPNPAPTITFAGSTTICAGQSVTLSSSIASGASFQWKKDGIVIPMATTASINITSAGSYTVVVTNTSTGCVGESPATVVVVNPLPAAGIAAGGPTTFCEGGSVNLSITPVAGIIYQWLNGSTSIAGATLATYSASTSGSYRVIVTNTATSCSDTSNIISVNVNPKPVAVITPSASLTLCTGGSVILNASPSTGVSYEWKKDGLTIAGATTSSYTATLAGVYTVIATNILTGCNGTSAAVTVTINPVPNAAVSSGLTICDGNTATLTATSTTVGAGFEWYNAAVGGSLVGVGASYTSPVLLTNTTYYVQSVALGCASARTAVLVSVDDCPDLCTVSISVPDSIICQGSPQTLTAVVVPSEVGTMYQWQRNGVDIAGATSSTYTTLIPGNYTVVASNSVCSAVASVVAPLRSGTVVWVDKVNTAYLPATEMLVKTSTSASFNAGAASHNILPAFQNGWVAMTVDELPGDEFFVLGLSNTNVNETETTIAHGFYFAAGNLKVMEMGGDVFTYGGVNIGDVLRIERMGSSILYKVNGSTVHTSTTDASLSAVIDASILSGSIPKVCASFRALPHIAPVIISNTSCEGTPSGKIVANVEFGYSNYDYVWSTGASTLNTSATADSIEGLSPGEYTLTLTDAYGDVVTQTYTVGTTVIWEILQDVAADAEGRLSKTGSRRGWTGGAISRNTMQPFEDGWVEFTTEAIATGNGYAVGLNTFDLGVGSLSTAEDGFIHTSGSLVIRSAGTLIPVGPAVSGDRLRVSREGGNMNYYRNGTLIYTTLIDESKSLSINALLLKGSTPVLRTSFCYPLRVVGKVTPTSCGTTTTGSIDLSISGGQAPYSVNWSTGSTDLSVSGLSAGFYSAFVEDASGEFVSRDYEIGNAVLWEDLSGVTPLEFGLERVLPFAGMWNSGAASTNRLAPDVNGWVEFHIDEANGTTHYIIGLSNLNIGDDDNWINHGIMYAGGQIVVSENGVKTESFGFALPGDILRVERSGSNILYSKNGEVFMVSTTDPSLELRVDVTIYKGRTARVVQTSFCGGATGGLAGVANSPVSEDELSETVFEVLPNPNTGLFKLNLKDEALAKEAQIVIMDVLGRTCYTSKVNVSGASLSESIDLANVSRGTYFLKVMSNGKNYIKKFVVE